MAGNEYFVKSVAIYELDGLLNFPNFKSPSSYS